MEITRQSCLYDRGDESIRIMSFLSGLTVLVCGPRSAEHAHHFDSEASLAEFRRRYEQRLIDDEWKLLAEADRRGSGQQRRPDQERRR